MTPFDPNKIIPSPSDRIDNEDDKYHNLDYIGKILADKNLDEMEVIRKINNWTKEELALYSDFAVLRKGVVSECQKDSKEREETGDLPSEEELSMGAFVEVIEPQVRDVVLALRRKGYNTFESGFYDFDAQIISFIDNVLADFKFPQELKKELAEEGIELEIEDDSIYLKFKKFKNIEEIENIWKKIEKELPDSGKVAEDSSIGGAIMFREKYLKNKEEEVFDNLSEEEKIRVHAEKILGTLGLEIDDFQGRKVLDVGSGEAELASLAKDRGVEIVSLDKSKPKTNSKKLEFVLGESSNLPFFDESFDLIISHAGPVTISNDFEDIKKTINEVERVLKKDGEFRFGPLGLNAEQFTDQDLFTDAEEKEFSLKEREERVKSKSLEILKSINPNIEEDRSSSRGFYILKKGL